MLHKYVTGPLATVFLYQYDCSIPSGKDLKCTQSVRLCVTWQRRLKGLPKEHTGIAIHLG